MLKRTIFSYIVPVAAVAAFIGGGVGLAGRNTSSFNGDGYVLTAADESANGGVVETVGAAEPTSVYFSAGTKYRVQYPSTAVFKDIEGSKQKINFDSFIHYGDDSISALTSGVLVNMDDLGTGVVNHYGTDANVVLVSDGDGYYVENNGNQVSFTNFMWKLSDTRFLLSSPSLALTLPDGSSQKVSGYVEAEYVEDGVIRLTSHDASWMVVADGTAAEFSDGISYDFGDKIVKDSAGNNRMTFQELLLDADDNIKVQSAEEWVAPEFDFSVEDGKDGAAGEAGAAGAAGAAGETGAAGAEGEEGLEGKAGAMGEEGESGSDGRTGTSGSNGKGGDSGTNGGNGNNGNNGKLFDTETKYQAYFNITEYEMDAGSLTVTFTVTDEEPVLLADTGSISLYNPSGSKIEWTSPDGSLVYADEGKNLTFDGDATYKVQWTNLNPDTEYRLVVRSGYEMQNGSGTRDYINRTFYTDSTGLQLDKIEAKDDGFNMKVVRKNFATSTGMQVVISDGTRDVLVKTISSSDFVDGELELDSTSFVLADKSPLTNTSLKSNTSYTVRLDNLVGSQAIPTGNTQTWKTLKKTPVIKSSKPIGYAANSQNFNLYLEDVEDYDNAIQGYRFEIYEAETSKLVKTIKSDKRTDVSAYIDADDSAVPDDQKLKRGVRYKVKVVVIYYDNEKTMEVESDLSDQFIMSEAGDVSVVFQRDNTVDDEAQTRLKGDVILNPGSFKIAASRQYPMEIRVDGTNFYKKTYSIDNLKQLTYHDTTRTYSFPIDIHGLKADSSYTITVWGYKEQEPGTSTYTYQNLGSYVATTNSLKAIRVEMVTAANSGSALGTYIYLGAANDETDPNTYDKTLQSMKAIEVKLYLGATANDDDSNMVGKPAIALADTNDPTNAYTNTIASKYYGAKGRTEGNQIYFDEYTFGLTSASLTASQYCVKVSAIYDYTKYYPYTEGENLSGYANEIPFTEDSVTTLPVYVVNRLPDFPNPQNSGVTATPIKFSDLKQLGISYNQTALADYEDDTIVGYQLQANYDNTGNMAKSITYYAVTQADLNDYAKDSDPNRADDVLRWREGQNSRSTPWMKLTYRVTDSNTIRVLFLDPYTEVSGVTSQVSEIPNITEDEKNANLNAANGIYGTYIGGSSIPTFFAKNLKRGWHYVFAYKARLDYQGNAAYMYPDNYTGRFVPGQTLLNSGIQDTPKQQTTLQMTIKGNGLNPGEEENGKGYIEWNYTYKDIDGSIPQDGKGLFGVWYASDPGNGSILNALHTDETNKIVGVTANGSISYVINKRQLLYNVGDRFSAADENDPVVKEYDAVSHVYSRPIQSTAFSDQQLLITPPSNNEGNVATISFNFDPDLATEMMNRLTLMHIKARDKNNHVIPGSTQSYRAFEGTDTSGHPYVTYDLSKAGAKGTEVTFEAEFYYDSGYIVDSGNLNGHENDRLAIQNTLNGRYIYWRYEALGDNQYRLSQSENEKNAGYAEYHVTNTATTSVEEAKATEAWKIVNMHNALPANPDETQYPMPVMNLKKTEGGLVWVDNRNIYPILKRVDTAKFSWKTSDGSNTTQYMTIPSLTPSVSDWWTTPGLTTLTTTFVTNSFHMIKETTPADQEKGRYIHVVVTEVTSDDKPVKQVAEYYYPLIDQETSQTGIYTFAGLESGKRYSVELFCVQEGTADNNEILLWNTAAGGSGSQAKTYVTLYSNMNIKNAEVKDVEYISYTKKRMELSYSLDLATGFDIQYFIYKKENGTFDPSMPLLNHGQVMDLMGYEQKDGKWVRKDNNNVEWTLQLNKIESLTFAPGCSVVPGGDYVLRIQASEGSNILGSQDVDFTWQNLSAPSFYVETTAVANGQGLTIRFNPVDTYKVIAGGTYYVAVWDQDTVKYVGGPYTVPDADSSTASQITSISVDQLESNKSYKIAFYGESDLGNIKKNALNLGADADAMKASLEHLKQTDTARLQEVTIYETTQSTLQSWGGRYSRASFGFNTSGSLMVYLFEASGLENITKIEVSLYSSAEGKSWTYTVTKPANGLLFNPVTGSTVNYQATIPTEITKSGSYQITRANFYTTGTEPAFYLTGDAVMP